MPAEARVRCGDLLFSPAGVLFSAQAEYEDGCARTSASLFLLPVMKLRWEGTGVDVMMAVVLRLWGSFVGWSWLGLVVVL